MNAARHDWLAAHPHLAPIATFEAVVQEAAERVESPRVEPPRWEAWLAAREAEVPLLRCAPAGLRITPAASHVLGRLVERAAETLPPGRLASAVGELRAELRGAERLARAIEWTVGGAPPHGQTAHPGLLRFLGWSAVSHVLAPVLGAAARAGPLDRWGHGRCPACGSFPALAHLLSGDGPRTRLLSCACCRTRWRYARTRCPFCSSAPERLRILEVEGDERLRLDVCDGCKGYVKTYVGSGEEELFLSDWPTLHLDMLARRRGLRRIGASLYELSEEGGVA